MKYAKRLVVFTITFVVGIIIGFYIFNRNQINESLRLVAMSFSGYDFSSKENLVHETIFDDRTVKFYVYGNKMYTTINDVMPVENIIKLDDIDGTTRLIYLSEDQVLYSNNEVVKADESFFTPMGNYYIYYIVSEKKYYLQNSKQNVCYYGDLGSLLNKYNCSKSAAENEIAGWIITEEKELNEESTDEFYIYDLLGHYNWDDDTFITDYIKFEISGNYVKVNYNKDQITTYQFYEITDDQLNKLLKILN